MFQFIAIASIFLTQPQNFVSEMNVVSCYCEWDNKLLVLKRQNGKIYSGMWGNPAGKVESGESIQAAILREIQEELGIEIQSKELSFLHTMYVQVPGQSFTYHIFRLGFATKPIIKLNSKEHIEYQWCPVSKYLDLPLVPGEMDCFKTFYRDFLKKL